MRRAHSRRSNASSEGVGTSLPTSRLPLRHGCRIADETRFGRPSARRRTTSWTTKVTSCRRGRSVISTSGAARCSHT